MLVLTAFEQLPQPYHFVPPREIPRCHSSLPFSTTPCTKMSTITRTWRNLRKIGIKEYAHQMMNIGDTKAGTYIATDRYGNKYYENQVEELPCMHCSS